MSLSLLLYLVIKYMIHVGCKLVKYNVRSQIGFVVPSLFIVSGLTFYVIPCLQIQEYDNTVVDLL